MANKTGIQRLIVEGLHEQFDVDLNFKPGLNIIYGKNGRGKTTVLHILVNALELDFRRFEHLNFSKISIFTFGGSHLEIIRNVTDRRIQILIDGEATSQVSESSSLSDAETATIRSALGPRPTYLPAFRSVLERVRYDYNSQYRDPSREAEAEEIMQKEFAALTPLHVNTRDLTESRSLREEAVDLRRKLTHLAG